MVKGFRVVLGLCVVGVLAGVLGTGCSKRAHSAPATPVTEFNEMRAWGDLKQQVEYGYRIPGTAEHKKTRDWIKDQLAASAAVVTLQPFSHRFGKREIQMWNIIGTIPGIGAEPREQVLLAAHWDTRPTADQDPDPAKRKTPILGANDSASGVAILLEIARQLKTHPIDRDVIIVFFDGEDYGPGVEDMLLGSAYYAKNLPTKKPDWGILLDMVGDRDLDIYREPNSDKFARGVNDKVFDAATELGYLRSGEMPGFVNAPFKYEVTDDHIALNKVGVPMVDLIDFNYPPWHTVGDTVDKCSPESLKIVGKTVLLAIQK